MASLGMTPDQISELRPTFRIKGPELVSSLLTPGYSAVVEFYDYRGLPIQAHYADPCGGNGFVTSDINTLLRFSNLMLEDWRNIYGEIQNKIESIPCAVVYFRGTPVTVTYNGDCLISLYSIPPNSVEALALRCATMQWIPGS
jgi:hypothetical protein